MWIHSRSTGSHLVSPPSGARPSPPALFAQVGSTEPGNEILLLTPKARQAVGEPVSARSCFFFFYGRRSVHSVCHAHGARAWHMLLFLWHYRLTLCSPHGICLVGWLCAWALWEVGLGWWWWWGCSPLPLRLALFRHFQLEGVVSVETDLNFKPI